MAGAAGTRRLQDQKRDFTRNLLLDSATQLFGSKGYNSTTAEDIATAAGSSRATFYLHFNSKSAVMIALLERAWPNIETMTTEFVESVGAGLTKKELRGTIAKEVETWQSTPGVMTAVNVAILIDPDVADWYYTNSAKAYQVLAGLHTGRKTRAKQEKLAKIAILSRMTFAALDLDAHRGSATTEQIVDYVTELWAQVLIEP